MKNSIVVLIATLAIATLASCYGATGNVNKNPLTTKSSWSQLG